jgi:predicted alpha/beta-hydrolase family hydrolase
VAERFSISLSKPAAIDAVPGLEYASEGKSAKATLILGHGAGAPQAHPWMVATSRGLAERGVHVVTFNFPYSELRRSAPDKPEVLEATWVAAIQAVRARPAAKGHQLFIGGKSMGGRIASQVASKWEEPAGPGGPLAGLVFFGYPLHPTGKPQQLRAAHLPLIKAPMLFIQGSKDSFGTPAELEPFLKKIPGATVYPIDGGDHSLRVSRTPAKQAPIDAEILDTVLAWMRAR